MNRTRAPVSSATRPIAARCHDAGLSASGCSVRYAASLGYVVSHAGTASTGFSASASATAFTNSSNSHVFVRVDDPRLQIRAAWVIAADVRRR